MSRKLLPIVVNKFSWLIAVALTFCVQLPARAQSGPTTEMAIDWTERQAPNAGMQAYDFSLLGDAIDLQSGRLSFEQVDVSIPGNFPLPVEIRRRLDPSQMQAGEFADWQLAIPTISTMILDEEWYAGNRWGKTRCNTTNLASAIPNASWPTHIAGGGTLPPAKWSNGVILDVPGRTTGQVLDKVALNNQTIPAAWHPNAKKVTVDGWYLECLTNIDGAGTEGFVAVAPNGDRYKFDVILDAGVKKSEFDVWQVGSSGQGGGPPPIYWEKVGVHYDTLAASEVTDVNGNKVTFNYSPAPSRKLTSIASSDNRQIDIARTGAYISSVTAKDYDPQTHAVLSQRQWTYAYAGKTVTSYKPPDSVNGAPGIQSQGWSTLSAVTLPNSRQWQYDLANLQARAVPGIGQCKQLSKTVSVTHPDGVTGTFTLQEISLYLGAGATGSSGAFCPNTNQGQNGSSQLTDVMAVTSKSLSGPGIQTSTWQFSYVSSGSDPIVTTVQQPDNSKRVSYFPTPFAFASARTNAKLTKEEVYATMSSPTPMETRTYTYVQEPDAGSNFLSIFSVQDTFRPVRLTDTVITRGSDTYTTHRVFNTTRTLSSYSYGFPVTVQKYSNVVTGTRQTDVVYIHNTSKWVLGLPDTITKNNIQFDKFYYDSNARVYEHDRFGHVWRTYGYSTVATELGMPSSMADAVHPATYFKSWKRGTPQEVDRADGYKLYRTVDDYGWVRGITDWNGNTTGYGYDLVGRLTGIDRPGTWTDTAIAYAYPNGSVEQTQTFGTETTTTTFDAMLRPAKVHKYAAVGGHIYVLNTFDAKGRKTFTSLPSSTDGSTIGIQTAYDALDRVTQVRETASGGGITGYEYLAANKIRITDPLNYQTTNTLSGYGSPDDGNTVKTQKPEGISVDFGYDLYGNQTSISQLKDDGTYLVSTFIYDDRLRLCRKKVPETGDTVYGYDEAFEMTAYAEGQASGSTCVTPPSGASVALTYNNIGRLTTTDYPSAPDITRTYDPNGNPLTVNRGGANWTYTYNGLDLVESESLSIDGWTYLIDEGYDNSGALTSKQYPSGRLYSFIPDGYGRPMHVAYGSTYYLGTIAYHPNGKISSLNRGNNGSYQQTLNARQFVDYVGGNWGTSLNLQYDLARRIWQIDSPNNSYDRTLTYDGVGRLATAIGPWGGGVYHYDKLSNLYQRVEGSRVVDVAMDPISNHVTSVHDSAVSSASRSYGYADGRGNVTSDGLHSFGYDDANQPISISGADSGSYGYDGNLKRVKQVVNGKTIYSIYDKSGAILTRDDATAGSTTDYLTLQGQTFVRVTNGTPWYPLNDQLGSAYMVADASGGITAANTYNFTPFGEGIGNDPGTKNEQGYTGHIEDVTGLTYMQARYYDPVTGRFLAADPIGFADQLNLYAYVGNDPGNRNDPTGTQEFVFGGEIFDSLLKPAGEMTRPIGETTKPIEQVVKPAENGVKPAEQTKPAKSSPNEPRRGAYRIETESGKWYGGKGPPERMAESVRRVEKQTGETVTKAEHNESNPNTNEQAFKDEAQVIRDSGGIKDPNSLNQRNSPGEKALPPPPPVPPQS